MTASARVIETEYGEARATVAGDGSHLLVLGHGAGGGIEAPDLVAVTATMVAAGWRVARVEQPYRLAGRRSPAPARTLDAAFLTVVDELRRAHAPAVLVSGGRSSGARVACRTALAAGVDAVVALAFPWRPPGKDVDRGVELLGAGVPTLVVQGTRDAFGGPEVFPAGPEVHAVAGADHSFRARALDGRRPADCVAEVADAVREWLQSRLA